MYRHLDVGCIRNEGEAMGLFNSLKQGLSDIQKDEKETAKFKGYADLNKDGKLDSNDLTTAKEYEHQAQSIADKLRRK